MYLIHMYNCRICGQIYEHIQEEFEQSSAVFVIHDYTWTRASLIERRLKFLVLHIKSSSFIKHSAFHTSITQPSLADKFCVYMLMQESRLVCICSLRDISTRATVIMKIKLCCHFIILLGALLDSK